MVRQNTEVDSGERKILDSYLIEPSKLQELKVIAHRLQRSKADLIREAIRMVLAKYGQLLE